MWNSLRCILTYIQSSALDIAVNSDLSEYEDKSCVIWLENDAWLIWKSALIAKHPSNS